MSIPNTTTKKALTAGKLSRRGFSVMSMAALAACTTAPANPEVVTEREVQITTPDGVMDAHYVAPSSGKWPAVLVWPDIMGLRPAFRLMANRLAKSGYAVLTVNPFYRLAKGQVFDATTEKFSDPPVRQRLVAPDGADGRQSGEHEEGRDRGGRLDRQAEGSGHVARHRHDRILHGRSAGDAHDGVRAGPREGRRELPWRRSRGDVGDGTNAEANSPHLLVPQMKAKAVLIAVAQNDDKQDPTVKETVKAAFDAQNIPVEVEVYPADHGWCPPDSQVFDQVQADRAWDRLLATFKAAL